MRMPAVPDTLSGTDCTPNPPPGNFVAMDSTFARGTPFPYTGTDVTSLRVNR